jgi:class 3 adenylate cyclase/predicted ATPase
VLFADLVESTALASQLDPEAWQQVVQTYHATCAAAIAAEDGYIAQYLGDGVLAYFGYPQAHEDDVRRAVRAGLALVAAVLALPPPGDRPPLRVRVGLHTGLVVISAVGPESRQEPLALGETPHVAARLQSMAAPGTVVCSEATARLVAGYVTVDALGGQTLKGLATPLPVYRVVGPSGAQSRLDATAGQQRTPFVGRDPEVALLRERWGEVQEGRGQVVVLSGEAGIGKSRLVQVVREQVVGTAAMQLVWQGVSAQQHSPLAPVITQLRQVLGREGAHEAQLQPLEHLLAPLARPEAVPLLAALLALPLPAHYPPLALAPQLQREQTLQTLLLWLLHTTEQQPVLLVVEDLHWCDPSTLELLELLLPQVPTARLGVLGTYRPEFTVPWTPRAHLTQMTLSRLAPPQVAQLVIGVTGGKLLPAAVLQQIVSTTDGVPLFVEELTKMVLEADWLEEHAEQYTLTAPLPPLAIPATLHDSLMARLDRLGAAKALAQLGATLGRQFSYALLQAVTGSAAAELQPALAHLVNVELLYQRGVPPQATYRFKHALIQEVAYQSLLRRTRQQYHQQIAQVLEAQFPETVATQPELLAYHYTEANLPEQGVHYWYTAGQRASERSAHVEALAHLRHGLQLLQTLPETPAQRQQEVDLHIALGASLIATKYSGAPEVEQTYTRAHHLGAYLEAPHQRFPVLRGLWHYTVIRAELQPAHALGQQLLVLAQHTQDPGMLLAAHRAVGTTLFHLGEVAAALTHWTQGMALYDPQQHRTYVFVYGEDAGVVCHGYASWTLWYLGYPAQGLVQNGEALCLAQQVESPLSLCQALDNRAQFHQFRREAAAAQEYAEACINLATEQGFPFWIARSAVLRGWALVQQGQTREGIEQIQQSLHAFRATGAELARSYFLALLAEAYGALEQPAAGLTVLAEALTLTDAMSIRWYQPELYRLQGALLLQQHADNQAEAERCFQHALMLARAQQAKALELRAATSLARLWQQQGKRAGARQLLAEVYGWFTEGFDTADLQEAQALLAALR